MIHRAFQMQLKDIAFTQKNMQSLQTNLQGTRAFLSSLQGMRDYGTTGQFGQEQSGEAACAKRIPGVEHHSSTLNALTLSVLVYLPIVVACVSIFPPFSRRENHLTKTQSFFSTTFVGLDSNAGGKKLTIASNAWWLPVASAPLIMISLFVWYAWSRLSAHRQERQRTCQVMKPISRV